MIMLDLIETILDLDDDSVRHWYIRLIGKNWNLEKEFIQNFGEDSAEKLAEKMAEDLNLEEITYMGNWPCTFRTWKSRQ